MRSDGMKVQLDFYLDRTAGHKMLKRYVDTVGVSGANTNGISS
jgi:hypothetical protein